MAVTQEWDMLWAPGQYWLTAHILSVWQTSQCPEVSLEGIKEQRKSGFLSSQAAAEQEVE